MYSFHVIVQHLYLYSMLLKLIASTYIRRTTESQLKGSGEDVFLM